MKPLETTFKRIETKYIISKDKLDKLIQDLKEYLVEDDYPISTISNIYFDTEDFDVLLDDDLELSEKKRCGCGPISATPKQIVKYFQKLKPRTKKELVANLDYSQLLFLSLIL